MRIKLLILLAALSLIACARSDEGNHTQWTALSLPGKTLELIDDDELQVFEFTNASMSSATIGERRGPVAAPILLWSIENDVLRISAMPHTAPLEELSDPTLDGSVVTATRKSGSRARYALFNVGRH